LKLAKVRIYPRVDLEIDIELHVQLYECKIVLFVVKLSVALSQCEFHGDVIVPVDSAVRPTFVLKLRAQHDFYAIAQIRSHEITTLKHSIKRQFYIIIP
jgi:hypothetical protein